MTIDIQTTRHYLQEMDFRALFNELGWNNPKNPFPNEVFAANPPYTRLQIAELGSVPIFEITALEGKIPDAKSRKAIYEDISRDFHENLLIFLDQKRTQSLWYWMKREHNSKKRYVREHLYVKGQPGDLSLGKLEAMTVDASELNQTGDASVVDVINKLKRAMDTEHVTKRFFEAYNREHGRLMHYIQGIEDTYDQRWYTSVLINRLMFIYFLQRKSFLDKGQTDYLQVKLKKRKGKNDYYHVFLKTLFFEGFAKKQRSAEANELLGHIRYLNGGLFLKHQIEQKWPDIQIPDDAFTGLFEFLDGYTWHLDDTPGGKDNDISPHVLGYIFEKYINQKSLGAYYTRPHLTEYLCERTISGFLLQKINALPALPFNKKYRFETLDELLTNLDIRLCHELLFNVLPNLSLLDPACGSGAFLVAALNMLIKIYRAITGQIPYLHDSKLDEWLAEAQSNHKSLDYYIKRKIVTENLYGVDIVDEAVEIAKLRLFLVLAASVSEPDELEPLPNIDFNIMHGNSLIGLLHTNEEAYNKQAKQLSLFEKSYTEIVAEKEALIARYQAAPQSGEDAQKLQSDIQNQREGALRNLNELLLNAFKDMKVKYEEASWDIERNSLGKPKRRDLQVDDILTLHPFHWSYEFSKVMTRGGFSIIITNPPWEGFKPQAKEFFSSRAQQEQIRKNKTSIEDFREMRAKLLKNPKLLKDWLEYLSTFPTQSALFHSAPQYSHQISISHDQKAGTDTNLYKVFTEQCYNLLCSGGLCGILLPSGIYTDLGAKGLREMLFSQTEITGMFGLENRKRVFEDVDSRYKFVVLTFRKGGETQTFPAIFMRQDANELEDFPSQESLKLPVELIRRLSPHSLSMMEFNDVIDIRIAEKMRKHPLLGDKAERTWKLELSSEFHMTNDSHLFKKVQDSDSLPLYQGKMMHQFTHQLREPYYWIDADTGRKELIAQETSRIEKQVHKLASDEAFFSIAHTRHAQAIDFLKHLGVASITKADICIAPDVPRLAFRDVARNTDERTLIATILPPGVFVGNTLNYIKPWSFDVRRVLDRPASVKECYTPSFSASTLAYLCGVFNSFILDYLVRFKVTTHVNQFYLYQLPVPRLTEEDVYFRMIARRVAYLICTTPQFQVLWDEIFPEISWSLEVVATDAAERAKLKAEIDGLVAHLYDLTEEEFRHVLSTFPQIEQSIKDAALNAFLGFSCSESDLRVADLIDGGETRQVEFKVAAYWNEATKRKDETMKENIVHTVAAFLNSKNGGTLLIGVDKNKSVVGLENDYKAANPQKRDRDGYLLFLGDILRNSLVNDFSLFYEISFVRYKQKDVCLIDLNPAPEPVFVKGGDFYIRDVGGKRKLTAHHARDYQFHRWSRLGDSQTPAQH